MIKKIFLIVFFLNILLADKNYELKLYEKILPLIFEKYGIKIFVDNEAKQILKDSKFFIITNNCQNADLLIGKNKKSFINKCLNKPLFATSYKGFKLKNSFGAFYWRKGRPQLKFKIDIIEKFNLKLPKNLRRYAQ